jgi:hypothetical protein
LWRFFCFETVENQYYTQCIKNQIITKQSTGNEPFIRHEINRLSTCIEQLTENPGDQYFRISPHITLPFDRRFQSTIEEWCRIKEKGFVTSEKKVSFVQD